MNIQEKVIKVDEQSATRQLVVTHVTIRQSISVLLLRLIVVELIAALGIILLHIVLLSPSLPDLVKSIRATLIFNVPLFLVLVLIKTILMGSIIIQWLEEYYEITPEEVIYKRGLIFKKEETNILEHLGSLEIKQTFLGKIFNYGSLKLYNWAMEKEVYLYLIHNPMKYYSILQALLPEADEKKQIVREHILEPEETP